MRDVVGQAATVDGDVYSAFIVEVMDMLLVELGDGKWTWRSAKQDVFCKAEWNEKDAIDPVKLKEQRRLAAPQPGKIEFKARAIGKAAKATSFVLRADHQKANWGFEARQKAIQDFMAEVEAQNAQGQILKTFMHYCEADSTSDVTKVGMSKKQFHRMMQESPKKAKLRRLGIEELYELTSSGDKQEEDSVMGFGQFMETLQRMSEDGIESEDDIDDDNTSGTKTVGVRKRLRIQDLLPNIGFGFDAQGQADDPDDTTDPLGVGGFSLLKPATDRKPKLSEAKRSGAHLLSDTSHADVGNSLSSISFLHRSQDACVQMVEQMVGDHLNELHRKSSMAVKQQGVECSAVESVKLQQTEKDSAKHDYLRPVAAIRQGSLDNALLKGQGLAQSRPEQEAAPMAQRVCVTVPFDKPQSKFVDLDASTRKQARLDVSTRLAQEMAPWVVSPTLSSERQETPECWAHDRRRVSDILEWDSGVQLEQDHHGEHDGAYYDALRQRTLPVERGQQDAGSTFGRGAMLMGTTEQERRETLARDRTACLGSMPGPLHDTRGTEAHDTCGRDVGQLRSFCEMEVAPSMLPPMGSAKVQDTSRGNSSRQIYRRSRTTQPSVCATPAGARLPSGFDAHGPRLPRPSRQSSRKAGAAVISPEFTKSSWHPSTTIPPWELSRTIRKGLGDRFLLGGSRCQRNMTCPPIQGRLDRVAQLHHKPALKDSHWSGHYLVRTVAGDFSPVFRNQAPAMFAVKRAQQWRAPAGRARPPR